MNREQGVSKSAEKTKKSGKIASPQITPKYFLKLPTRNHLIFQPKLPVCPWKWPNKTVLDGRG